MSAESDKFFLDLLSSGSLQVKSCGTIIYKDKIKKCHIQKNTKRDKNSKNYSNAFLLYIYEGHKTHTISVARLVWMAFNGPIPKKQFVVRKDSSDVTNVALDNLQLESCRDFVLRSTTLAELQGRLNNIKSTNIKLSDELVNKFRRLCREPNSPSYNEMAKEAGVSRATIIYAISGRTFKHCNEPPVKSGIKAVAKVKRIGNNKVECKTKSNPSLVVKPKSDKLIKIDHKNTQRDILVLLKLKWPKRLIVERILAIKYNTMDKASIEVFIDKNTKKNNNNNNNQSIKTIKNKFYNINYVYEDDLNIDEIF